MTTYIICDVENLIWRFDGRRVYPMGAEIPPGTEVEVTEAGEGLYCPKCLLPMDVAEPVDGKIYHNFGEVEKCPLCGHLESPNNGYMATDLKDAFLEMIDCGAGVRWYKLEEEKS